MDTYIYIKKAKTCLESYQIWESERRDKSEQAGHKGSFSCFLNVWFLSQSSDIK